MQQQPAFSLATPPLRHRPLWPARASWQVARASPRWWLRRAAAAALRLRVHPLVEQGLAGGIMGILAGWLFAWALLWITA
ncbi:hypothetical protein [Roseomonas haemaphysalidis]|uniref:Uncharacterized protein n=1 Tax=Roseomonas haemaphysalidis TaxID=2768162 RepID=A0ABS3KUR0_9PROT|nr:hypothetical protein [Roseomonas haemaphysalidis]MBO1080343.1 hypothetical protein [Roseomonas haemaphysalidis]